eukprot:CCRYP_020378-RA/>CCRYP_020378-RA protein AED:0.00 eAED:0.00 QI:23/1/1/1/0/0/2/93/33
MACSCAVGDFVARHSCCSAAMILSSAVRSGEGR